jgi:hypothetical protein
MCTVTTEAFWQSYFFGGKYAKSKEHEFTLCSMYYFVLPKREKNALTVHCFKVVRLLSRFRMYFWVIYHSDIVKMSSIDIHKRDNPINIQTVWFFTTLIINWWSYFFREWPPAMWDVINIYGSRIKTFNTRINKLRITEINILQFFVGFTSSTAL